MVSVEHNAEHDPNQANNESDNAANQCNGSPRLHAQESSVVQIKNETKQDYYAPITGPGYLPERIMTMYMQGKHLLLSIHGMKK